MRWPGINGGNMLCTGQGLRTQQIVYTICYDVLGPLASQQYGTP
jgi:hypothetical protein